MYRMNNIIIGGITGLSVIVCTVVADVVAGVKHIDVANALSIIVPVGGFSWYLSARLTRIEDTLRGLDCMRCPKPKKKKDEA